MRKINTFKGLIAIIACVCAALPLVGLAKSGGFGGGYSYQNTHTCYASNSSGHRFLGRGASYPLAQTRALRSCLGEGCRLLGCNGNYYNQPANQYGNDYVYEGNDYDDYRDYNSGNYYDGRQGSYQDNQGRVDPNLKKPFEKRPVFE